MSLVNPSGGSCRRTDSLLATAYCAPDAPLRGRLRHERAAPQPLGLRHPLREWLDGVSDALCMSPPLASGLPPLRHCGDTLAPTPAGDYAPRASHFHGAQRTQVPLGDLLKWLVGSIL